MAASGAAAHAAGPQGSPALKVASELVRQSGASGGICAVIGADDAELPMALSQQGRFVVHCLDRDPARCESLRKAICERGAYGTVSAGTFDGAALPYTDNLINVAVLAGEPVGAAEALRVLAPLGTGFVRDAGDAARAELRAAGAEDLSVLDAGGTKWLAFRKPWPADIDEWTHYLHAADGNPVAADRVVGPPRHYQWLAGPTWLRSHETDSSVSTLVTAGGRLFYITDEAPISLAGDHALPDKWSLAARDAFNGVLLWKVPIRRWGWREWKNSWFNTRPGDVPLNIQKRLVASGDKVYVTLGYHAPVSQLDARTGEILRTYDGTDPTGEVLLVGGTLVLSVLDGERVRVSAVDTATGKRLWTTAKAYAGSTVDYIKWRAMRGATKPAKLDASLNLATDGRAVALIDGNAVVGLDFRTGAERWRTPFPLDPADLAAGGIRSGGNLWIGTMIVRDGVVLHASPSKLAGISAETGKVLWEQPKKYIGHLWYEWKDVFVIDGLAWTWGADLERGKLTRGSPKSTFSLYPRTLKGYDLRTGELKGNVDLGVLFKTHHHHRCYRNKATVRYVLASRRGTEYVDLTGRQHTLHNWVRGTCHVGMMPANGLLYAPPHPCVCYLDEKLNGLLALAPAPAKAADDKPAAPPLEKGPAYAQVGNRESEIGKDDWPTFRHDAMRTGSVATALPDGLTELWRVKAGTKLSAPVAVGDKLFVALVDEHSVACLDAASGRTLWQFAAGGRVDSPPTWHDGSVLFGSADGWVYCLRASDGQLAWRFRAAPRERLIGADGQLESAWPVHGSVLVLNGPSTGSGQAPSTGSGQAPSTGSGQAPSTGSGQAPSTGSGQATVYFAAGRTSELDGGIHLYGLDAATGKQLHHTLLEGPDYATDAEGKLVVSRASAAMRPGEQFPENYDLPMGALPDVLMGDGELIYMRTMTFDAGLKRTRGKAALSAKGGFLDDSYFKRAPWTFGGRDYARLIVHDERNVCSVRMFDSLEGLDPSVYFTPGAKGYLLFAKGPDGKRELWSQRLGVRVRAMVLAGGRLVAAGPPDVLDAKDPLGAFEGRKGGVLCVFDSASGRKLAEQPLASPPVFHGAAAARGRLFLTAEDGSVSCFGKR